MPLDTARILVVIPSRYASRRLPGKALAELGGQPMVWHAYQRAMDAGIGPVIVATDDRRILGAVRSRGGEAVMTSSRWCNGSERVAEVARARPGIELVINLQGDEPLMDSTVLSRIAAFMDREPGYLMGTPAAPLGEGQLHEASVVKVEVDGAGTAVSFWRDPADRVQPDRPPLRHLGVYAYRREALLRYAELPPSPLERERSLEQMRAMEGGMPIGVVVVDAVSVSVDTPAGLSAARRELAVRR